MKSHTFAKGLAIVMFAFPFLGVARAQDGDHSFDREKRDGNPCRHIREVLDRDDDNDHGKDEDKDKDHGPKPCRFGGGTGIVKGDFNGDGIADLAIGVPDETRTNVTFQGTTSTVVATPGAGVVVILFGSASNGLTGASSEVFDANPLGTPANLHFGSSLVAGKFRDMTSQFSDLAVGVPGVTGSGGSNGAVFVYYNQNGVLSNLFGQNRTSLLASDVDTTGSIFNQFGVSFPSDMAMTWGDFNGDGFGDLAVEVRQGTCPNCVSGVAVFFGGPFGLSSTNSKVYDIADGFNPGNFIPATGCPTSTVFSGRHFCAKSDGAISLGSADLNGDGIDELLIGSPGCHLINDSGSKLIADLGCVAVVPGTRGAPPSQFFGWSVLVGDQRRGFGSAITVGDFDGDGLKDVAVGEPGVAPQLSTQVAGAVRIFAHPNLQGVTNPNNTSTLINQDTPGIGGTQSDGLFGAALTANDFNGDGVSDLVVGSPNETVEAVPGSGQVNVIFGQSGVGLSGTASSGHLAAQTIQGALGSATGAALTAWNFGKSTQADLVLGVPHADVSRLIRNINGGFTIVTTQEAGDVVVFYGSSSGLNITTPQRIDEGQIPGEGLVAGNHFGAAVY